MGILTRNISRCRIWGEFILIFVCVGSREYQFNRLLKEIDDLIEENRVTEDVFAQIGQSSYLPKNYEYERFLSANEFKKKQESAHLIISHAGTGALMGALKLGKKTIAVPRLEKFGEHTDDHQLQIASVLEEQGYLKKVIEISQLEKYIDKILIDGTIKKYNKESKVLEIIDTYIQEN